MNIFNGLVSNLVNILIGEELLEDGAVVGEEPLGNWAVFGDEFSEVVVNVLGEEMSKYAVAFGGDELPEVEGVLPAAGAEPSGVGLEDKRSK